MHTYRMLGSNGFNLREPVHTYIAYPEKGCKSALFRHRFWNTNQHFFIYSVTSSESQQPLFRSKLWPANHPYYLGSFGLRHRLLYLKPVSDVLYCKSLLFRYQSSAEMFGGKLPLFSSQCQMQSHQQYSVTSVRCIR